MVRRDRSSSCGQRGLAVMRNVVEEMRKRQQEKPDKESWNNLFGNRQYEKR